MAQQREFFYPSARGDAEIHAMEWLPEGTPRAVLQISHGICEYIGRYAPFAEYLAEHGFIVVGNDHLGHGKSWKEAPQQGLFAPHDGWRIVVDDIETLRRSTRQAHPELPYFLLGHSMGSFLARTYLIRYPGNLQGAVLSGTGQQPAPLVLLGQGLTRVIGLFRGHGYRSKLVNRMAFGSYNRHFQPERTKSDWVCSDPAVVDAYEQDPDCQFLPTVTLYRDMMDGIAFISRAGNLKKMDKDMPVLFFSGAMDPVGEEGKGVARAAAGFCAAGCRQVNFRLYPGGRHEMLNEVNRQTVYADVLAWLNDHMPKAEEKIGGAL